MTLNNLTTQSKYLHISIPYYMEDSLITFDDGVMTELECDEDFAIPMLDKENLRINIVIDLSEGRVVDWNNPDGYLRMQAKVRDGGTYTLLDDQMQPRWQIRGYVPSKLIPPYEEGYGDYITLEINADGTIANWRKTLDFSEFAEEGKAPKPVPTNKWYRAKDVLRYISGKHLTQAEIVWLIEQLKHEQ